MERESGMRRQKYQQTQSEKADSLQTDEGKTSKMSR